jgi:AraC-like DNA-binding protein
MPWRFYPPAPRLAAFVASIWLYRSDQQERLRLLPSGTAQLVIDLTGDGLPLPGPLPGRISTTRSRDADSALLYGVDSAAFSLEHDRPTYEIGVDFQPGGIYPFFAPPASELHNLHVSLEALWGSQVVRELREQLAEADTLEARAGILEELLVRQMVRPLAHHMAVASALRAISVPSGKHEDAQHTRITHLAEEAGLSQGHFARLFKEEVGLTPKHYARVRRFLRVMQRINSERCVNWARLALECGYYDQAHFSKEFQTFAGVCPSAYLRTRSAATPSILPQAE